MVEQRIHLIFWGEFKHPVLFCKESAENMRDEEEAHRWGWKTLCGHVLWSHWKGATNWEQVTCDSCMKAFRCYVRGESHD